MNLREPAPPSLEPRFSEWISRREHREPTAYILGAREFFLMGNPLRCLQHEGEALRHLLAPLREHAGVGHAVEGVVDLHRVEALRVKRQHLRGRQVFRIEASLPFFVAVAAGPDADAHRVTIALLFAGPRCPHFDVSSAHADVEASRRKRRRPVHDAAILERELGPMPRALNGIADQLPFRERAA